MRLLPRSLLNRVFLLFGAIRQQLRRTHAGRADLLVVRERPIDVRL